jgi:hypothetical protein
MRGLEQEWQLTDWHTQSMHIQTLLLQGTVRDIKAVFVTARLEM